MIFKKNIVLPIIAALTLAQGVCQESGHDLAETIGYSKAYQLAFAGDHKSARAILSQTLKDNPSNQKARSLLASTYSWTGEYDKARSEFNKITSVEKGLVAVWISAIKNELYAKRYATALGLANKAAMHVNPNEEIERLRSMAHRGIADSKYPELGWHNQDSRVAKTIAKSKKGQPDAGETAIATKKKQDNELKLEETQSTEIEKNRLAINNSFTVFSERYDPMVYSSVQLRHETKIGNLIPRINYSNRLGQHGVQYDLDFYPKFLKRFYAYLNYGYSNAEIYPRHKFGGDIYANLPGAIELSGGGRYIVTQTQNITAITNSIGHYRGNYYFSLRSFITPRPDGLTRMSGNLLVRKYLRDAENFMGFTIGMGISPELQQIVAGDQLLAETLLYVESQRLRLEYQFTGKKTPNIYRANMGVLRQELTSESGQFFWGVSAGLTYEVKF